MEELKEVEIKAGEAVSDEGSEQVSLGLDLADTEGYSVNDGVADPVISGDGGKGKKKGGAGKMFAMFLLGAVCCMGVMLFCTRTLGLGRYVSEADYEYYETLSKSYGKYHEILKFIDEDPLAETSPEEISDAELKEIVSGIGDPYAMYYTPKEYEDFQKKYLGDYVGVGITVTEEDGKIVVKGVFEDSPAEEAGIKEEDVIIKVDGKEPKDLDNAVQMITGESGTEVNVTVMRGSETLDFTMTREKIETDSVAYTILDGHPDIGYIVLTSFINGTDEEFKMAVKDLQSQGCTKFILDLRDNGGGLIDPCMEIADYLLPSCRIMSENTKAGEETVHNSDESSADLELVVLVNENTASSSEILTAALQDNGACKVIGTVTFGKGVTQTIHQFRDGSAIKITATEYFRPSGEKVHGIGITPDIEVDGEDALNEALKELEK